MQICSAYTWRAPIAALALGLAACGGQASDAQSSTTAEPATQTPVEESAEPSVEAEPALVAVGAPAPPFTALDQSGAEHSLASERGHVVVLYFYPRDATPGCTTEACAFRDAWSRYEEAGVRLFGVSTDDVASHRAFAEEHELPFPLLADPDSVITDAYGVRLDHEGSVYARRVTYVIDAEGTVARVFDEVDPGVHADEVLAAVAEL